ncbi:MAG TPA: hypothetical protein VKX16_19080 [Chloroflexota bacterium]|nr:hypothetical protein [Chloroflexota bacterium]
MLSRLSLACFLVLIFPSVTAASPPPSEASLAHRFPPPPIRARAAVVMDASTGAVLEAVNPHLRLPMASTTKIMTAVLALKLGHLADRIRVPKAAFNFEADATVMGLHPGEKVTLRDLLYGLLLPSGADAANTIAIHYAGSEKTFVALMNREAQVLGMKDTHFMDAHGLAVKNHYSTAYDLALLGRYASTIPELMKVAATRYYTWNGQVLTNINHVLFWYPGVDGIKPGWIPEAGICQVLDAQRNGRHIIVSILNTPDLVVDARDLLNYGLEDFTWSEPPYTSAFGPTTVVQGRDAAGPYDYYVATGHFVRGSFLHTYLADGGPATLGFPRTEVLTEGTQHVQYFQNGALALDSASGRLARLALGAQLFAPPPPVTHVPKPTATLHEGTVVLAGTRTPTPRPHATPTPTAVATPTAGPQTAKYFAPYQHLHPSRLGAPVTPARWIHGYSVQMFAYAALVYDPRSRTATLLPIGDYELARRHFLPKHPGTAYPAGFASTAVLDATGWLPGGL